MMIEKNKKRLVSRSLESVIDRQYKLVGVQLEWSVEKLTLGVLKEMASSPGSLREQSFTPFVLRHGS